MKCWEYRQPNGPRLYVYRETIAEASAVLRNFGLTLIDVALFFDAPPLDTKLLADNAPAREVRK